MSQFSVRRELFQHTFLYTCVPVFRFRFRVSGLGFGSVSD